mmetsp:Transcript_13823/g.35264  ORF Transcript_13823/g.35264 Transcript_13823/m.35264 type:complete len:282 (+) Transcript_13823:79-924(+)
MQTCSLIGFAVGVGATLLVEFLIWLAFWIRNKIKSPSKKSKRKYQPPSFGHIRLRANSGSSDDEHEREALFESPSSSSSSQQHRNMTAVSMTPTSAALSNSGIPQAQRISSRSTSSFSSMTDPVSQQGLSSSSSAVDVYSLAIVETEEPESNISFGLSLVPQKFPLENERFQERWLALPSRGSLALQGITLWSAEELEQHLAEEYHVHCKASGTVGNEQKFYFYTRQEHSDELFLIEVIINLRDRSMVAHVKCQNESAGRAFHSYMESALQTLFLQNKQFV